MGDIEGAPTETKYLQMKVYVDVLHEHRSGQTTISFLSIPYPLCREDLV